MTTSSLTWCVHAGRNIDNVARVEAIHIWRRSLLTERGGHAVVPELPSSIKANVASRRDMAFHKRTEHLGNAETRQIQRMWCDVVCFTTAKTTQPGRPSEPQGGKALICHLEGSQRQLKSDKLDDGSAEMEGRQSKVSVGGTSGTSRNEEGGPDE